jgi:hypothetical protein
VNMEITQGVTPMATWRAYRVRVFSAFSIAEFYHARSAYLLDLSGQSIMSHRGEKL